ncbi:MAG TPA: selenium cofactor biosynthesis protein YqeC [candidate division Zixibacteria bacterium]|nr:selenium cofactor biosynthesis protein YqeC [candidate division Zixibacteria bacterium]
MQLSDAIGLRAGEMVSLIGAGGKTSCLFRLAAESRQAGRRVLVTTTTKILKPARPHVDRLFLVQEPQALLARARQISPPQIIGAGYGVDEEGKLIGLPAKWVDEYRASGIFDQLLVEADGAASRLFKVPSEIEPVVPATCDLTVWVMSVKVLGKPLRPEWVHRAERALSLLGLQRDVPVTREVILRLVRDPNGCLKGIPGSSRKVALLNQADSAEEIENAREVARDLIRAGITRVVITSFAGGEPVKASIAP